MADTKREAFMVSGRGILHPLTTGPTYVDEQGSRAVFVSCPDCHQMEWWTEAELQDHGKCRASNQPCWCESNEK